MSNRNQPQRPSPAPQVSTARPNASFALPQPIASGGSEVDRTTKIYTYNTVVGNPNNAPQILYNGDRNWAKVTLTLDTAGPVVVGDSASLEPIFSGKGWTLTTDQPISFTIAKGTRLYIFSSAVNRVKVEIAPLPWLEQIVALSTGIHGELTAIRTGKR